MHTLLSVSFTVTCLGAIQWGLIGLGGFIGKNLNVIGIISRGNALLEYSLYIFIGLSAVCYIWLMSRD